MSLKTLFLPGVLLVTFIVLLFFRKRLQPKYLQLFIIYVAVCFLTELTAHLLTYFNRKNIVLYNIEMIFEISFFAYIFYRSTDSPVIKKIISYFFIFFLLFAFINLPFIQGLRKFNTYTYTIGSLFLTACCFYYLFNLIFSKETENPFRIFLFWVSIGLLFCYLGNLPYLSTLNKLFTSNWATARSLSIISKVVNTILYLSIITGAVCQRKVLK